MQFKVSGKREPMGRFWQDPITESCFFMVPSTGRREGGDEMSDENLILGFVVCVERCVLFPPCMFA